MSMNDRPRSALASLAACGLLFTAGCADEASSSAEGCSLTASIGFDGREYTATNEVDGITRPEVTVGRRVGVGQAATACAGADAERVQVYKVVGIPATRAVFAKPVFGLMQRTHFDQE